MAAFFDHTFWLTAGSIALLLLLSAFFSGSETALTAASTASSAQREEASPGAARSTRAITTTASATTEPTERSMPAVMMTSVAPIAAAETTADCTRMFSMLRTSTNLPSGTSTAKSVKTKASASNRAPPPTMPRNL